MRWFRAALVTVVAGTALVAVPGTAVAAPPTSAVEVSSTALKPGDTFTVTQTVYNAASFTIDGGKALLVAQGSSLPSRFDLVSCPGAVACYPASNEYRAAFGAVPSGESRTVVFTFKVRDDAPAGPFTLMHQFIGDAYSFQMLEGPVITITPDDADLGVVLNATARGLLTSRITYTVTVKNDGPATATGIRVTVTYPAGLVYAGSSNCSRVPGTRTVTCDIASLASGAGTTRSFTADAGLLTIGPLTATAQRTTSSPTDPNAANDKATKTCTALTSLLVSC